MTSNYNFISLNYNFVSFDGEPDGDDPAEPKTFTQEEVNTIMAKEKRKTQEIQRKLMSQLEESKKKSTIGSDERNALEQQIEELQKQTMTAAELAAQKEAKLQKKHKEELESIQNENNLWKTRFSKAIIGSNLRKAAEDNGAISTDQIKLMLESKVRLVQKADENGKPTNDFETRIDFQDTNKNGEPVVLDLTVNDAVKRMTELPQYGNLFKGGKISGLDGTNVNGKDKKLDIAELARTDPAKFRELRKSNPELLYGKR